MSNTKNSIYRETFFNSIEVKYMNTTQKLVNAIFELKGYCNAMAKVALQNETRKLDHVEKRVTALFSGGAK